MSTKLTFGVGVGPEEIVVLVAGVLLAVVQVPVGGEDDVSLPAARFHQV